ncbi:MAG: hypothetical protein KAT14_02680 [Candidatus Marinimicrobia bacterium]|nr:hypothetical protein [Candidatus Neomarinimicrobiota bacterium]
MVRKIISIILILSFVLLLYGEATYSLGQVRGKRDGKQDASWLWVFAGLGCNCVGPAVAYFVPGDVPAGMILGQPSEYALGYSASYIQAKRWRQVTWATVGMIIQNVIVSVALAAGV